MCWCGCRFIAELPAKTASLVAEVEVAQVQCLACSSICIHHRAWLLQPFLLSCYMSATMPAPDPQSVHMLTVCYGLAALHSLGMQR
jgi:hypothetical protein